MYLRLSIQFKDYFQLSRHRYRKERRRTSSVRRQNEFLGPLQSAGGAFYLDVDRDACRTDREDRVLMHDSGSHI